ncbi:MetQ/NlpA family ABC transporter substrate-binding protein [Celeribacter sp. ULVN23_4]
MNPLSHLAAGLFAALTLTTPALAQDTIRLGVSFYPFHSADETQADLIDVITPELAEKGYAIEKTVFLNYAEANPALAHGEIDGNLIQHEFYMGIFNDRSGADLVIAQPVYHATFALYSGQYSDLSEIAAGTTVFIPNDGVNTARAFLLLESARLIELAEGVSFEATEADIAANPLDLIFVQTPLTATAGAYDEAGRTLAVMYPTFARALALEGDAERIFIEERNAQTDRYAVSYAVNAKDLDDAKTQAVAEALRSDAVADFLRDTYGWASTPAR